jgi:hypothetical protein
MGKHERPDTAGIAHEIAEEVSEALALPPKMPLRNGSRFWHYAGAVLAGILAAAALAGGLGRAFFVGRDEYTVANTANAVDHERMRLSLEQMTHAINSQTIAIEKLRETVQAQGTDLAIVRRRR